MHRSPQQKIIRSEQYKESEYQPQGVYTDVHDQGGTELDIVMRCLS